MGKTLWSHELFTHICNLLDVFEPGGSNDVAMGTPEADGGVGTPAPQQDTSSKLKGSTSSRRSCRLAMAPQLCMQQVGCKGSLTTWMQPRVHDNERLTTWPHWAVRRERRQRTGRGARELQGLRFAGRTENVTPPANRSAIDPDVARSLATCAIGNSLGTPRHAKVHGTPNFRQQPRGRVVP